MSRATRRRSGPGPKGPFATRDAVATLLGFPEKNVRVIYHEASGTYGRMSTDDGAEDAALLSRAVGTPVRVQWSRQDEHGWEPKGPAQLDEVKSRRRRRRQNHRLGFCRLRLSPGPPRAATPLLASLQVGMKPTNPGGSNGTKAAVKCTPSQIRMIVADHINWHFPEPIPLRTSNLRAPGDIARCFASECFIDEIAADLKVDPVQFRLRHLTPTNAAPNA